MISSPDINQSKNQIQLLPEHLIDQIKAGEVIERPASLIKELIENSIDANSKTIHLHIIENGLDLISISDDGEGMTKNDLPFAFCRHATSKIQRFEDLYKLHTYGFRGEALASMSSISRVTCTSIPKNNLEDGGKIIIHGGKQKSVVAQTGTKSGTSIYIKDLFYNTPARLKFIKSKISEKNSLKKTIFSFILSNPQITFTVKWDQADKLLFPKVCEKEVMAKRASKILFKKSQPQEERELIHINSEYEGYKISGYISKWSSKGGSGKSHFLFVNRRYFTDTSIHQIMRREMERYWPSGHLGHSALFLELPPNEIDVNVHPNKTYIKFFKPSIVFSLVSGSIKTAIQAIQNERPLRDVSALDSSRDEGDQSQSNSVDIREFSHSPFAPTPERSQNPLISNLDRNNEIPYNLENGIYFGHLKNGHEKFLINLNSLLSFFLKKELKVAQNIIPLLISEPFRLDDKFDKMLEPLKVRGLEFDRIEKDLFLLRTIPQSLTLVEPGPFLKPWFESLLDQDSFTIPENLNFHSFSPCSGLWDILLSYPKEELLNKNIIISVDSSFWNKIFSR